MCLGFIRQIKWLSSVGVRNITKVRRNRSLGIDYIRKKKIVYRLETMTAFAYSILHEGLLRDTGSSYTEHCDLGSFQNRAHSVLDIEIKKLSDVKGSHWPIK